MVKRPPASYSLVLFAFFVVMGFLTAGCNILSTNGCVACHTDEETLQAVADPIDDPDGDSGEG